MAEPHHRQSTASARACQLTGWRAWAGWLVASHQSKLARIYQTHRRAVGSRYRGWRPWRRSTRPGARQGEMVAIYPIGRRLVRRVEENPGSGAAPVEGRLRASQTRRDGLEMNQRYQLGVAPKTSAFRPAGRGASPQHLPSARAMENNAQPDGESSPIFERCLCCRIAGFRSVRTIDQQRARRRLPYEEYIASRMPDDSLALRPSTNQARLTALLWQPSVTPADSWQRSLTRARSALPVIPRSRRRRR